LKESAAAEAAAAAAAAVWRRSTARWRQVDAVAFGGRIL